MTTKMYIMQIKNIYNNIGKEEKMLIKNIINNNIGKEEKMFIDEVRNYMDYIEENGDEDCEDCEDYKNRHYINLYMKEIDKLEKYVLCIKFCYNNIDDIDEEKKMVILNIKKNMDAIERLRKKLKNP